MGFCPKCGAKVHDEEIFCISCGEKLPTDRHQRFQTRRFSAKDWIMPIGIFVLITLVFLGILLFHYNRTNHALDAYKDATTAFNQEDYEESLTYLDKALNYYSKFPAANDLQQLLTIYLSGIEIDNQLSYNDQLKQLNNLQIALDDFDGENIDQFIMDIKHQQERLQLDQIESRLSDDLSIQDLQALVWEIDAIHSTDALMLKQQLRERLSTSIASIANTYLSDNRFPDASEVVKNGLYYLPDDERLLSLTETINVAQNQFVTALEERMEKAYQTYEEEVVFNESKAVELENISLKKTASSQLKIEGTVISQATVPIYHVHITFELLNKNNDIIDTRESYVYPDVLYPSDEGKLDYVYLDNKFNNEATDVKVTEVSWLLNEEDPS